jgi:hypothetical protein
MSGNAAALISASPGADVHDPLDMEPPSEAADVTVPVALIVSELEIVTGIAGGK